MKNRYILAAVAFVAIAVSSCGNAAKDAEKTIRDFGAHAGKKAFKDARNLLTKASLDIWDIAVEMAGDSIASQSKDMDKQKITCDIKGEKGVCATCCNREGKADSVYMAKEDGVWKIDLAADPRMKEAKESIEKAGGKEKMMEQIKAMKAMMEQMKNMTPDSSGAAVDQLLEEAEKIQK